MNTESSTPTIVHSINVSLIGSKKVISSYLHHIHSLVNSTTSVRKSTMLTINTNLACFKINLQQVPNKSKNIHNKKIFDKSNAIIIINKLENCTLREKAKNIIHVCDIAPSGASSSHIADHYVIIDTKNKINMIAPLEEVIKNYLGCSEFKILNYN